MTISFPFLTNKGVLGLRTFASVADLPGSPNPGQLCAVDDGTVTTVYQALRSGASVSWFIVATPVSPFTVVRANPSDSRELQFSNDNGATWPFACFLAADAVTTSPQTSGENVVTSTGAHYALQLINDHNFSALLASSVGDPAIVAKFTDGANGAPGLRLISTDPTNSSPAVDFAYEGGSSLIVVNRYGAITALEADSLPTASVYWQGAFIRVPDGSGHDKTYTCIQTGSTTYQWVQIAPILPPVIPAGYVNLYPDLPPVGGAAITFPFLVMAQGCPLPWILPTGYTVQVADPSNNYFGNDDGTNTYFNNLEGSLGASVSGFPINRLIFSKFAVDINGKVTSTLGTADAIGTGLTASEYMVVTLGANTPAVLSVPPVGIAIVALTVIPPSSFDVNITYDDGSGPAGAVIGETIEITPGLFTSSNDYAQFVAHFSTLATWKWVSGSVNERLGGPCDFCWNVSLALNCEGTGDTYYIDSTLSNNTPSASVNAHQGESHQAHHMSSTNGNLSGPFFLQLVSVP